MGQGQGSITVNQKAPLNVPAGPPFTLNSADNGLSVDPVTFHTVLGQSIAAVGDPARLLSNREIPLNGFELFMRQGANPLFELNGSGIGANLAGMGDLNGSFGNNGFLGISNNQSALLTTAGINYMALFMLSAPALAQLGDIAGFFNGDFMQIDANNGVTQLGKPNTDPGLIIDTIQRQYSIGDLTPLGNGLQLLIDDNSGTVQLGDGTFSGNGTAITMDDPNQFIKFINNANDFLSFDFLNRDFLYGDIVGAGNNSTVQLNDPNKTFVAQFTGLPFLSIDAINGFSVLGNSGGTRFQVTEGTQLFEHLSAGGTGAGGIKTNQPSATGAGTWLLGKRVAAASVLDATQYIEVMIDGVVRKLALIV